MIFHITIEPNIQLLIKLFGLRLAVTGNQSSLCDWSFSEVNVLDSDNCRDFFLKKNGIHFPFEYKYILVDSFGTIRYWQDGDNYSVNSPVDRRNDIPLFFDAYPRISGMVLPVFSMRSNEDYGIGEFPDIKLLADIALKCGLRMIQTLPVNDTTLTRTNSDSYPYNPLSVLALHPLYIRLDDIEGIDENLLNEYHKEARKLNYRKKVDYEKVCALKWKYLKASYDIIESSLQNNPSYRAFVKGNESWVKPYALYCYFRDKYHTSDFRKWEEMPVYDDSSANLIFCSKSQDLGLYIFIQYCAEKQLKDAVDYAHSKGILLKGDIPIGVSRFSLDVWMEPELFNTDLSAGAPPDFFSQKGQNWGFPTYNWDTMFAKDNYAWWKRRLKQMSKFFDAYRIDHILGFFRIWSVRTDELWGVMGQFNKAKAYTLADISPLGLSYDELTESLLTKEQISSLFGSHSDDIIKNFTSSLANGLLHFKKKCSTQKAICALCKKLGIDDRDTEKLLALRTQVLFIKDINNVRDLHPRIDKEHNGAYDILTDKQKEVYNYIYDDYFYKRNNELWREEAFRKLPELLRASDMIVCGEDLGMISDCVPEVMQSLKILSLEIQSMPKQKWAEFDNLSQVPYYSVCTTTTHDMAPLRLWWKEMYLREKDKLQRFYRDVLGLQDILPAEINSEIIRRIVTQHLDSSSIMAVLPLQDYLALSPDLVNNIKPEDERVNVPDNPNNIWSYRMNISLENLLDSESFISSVKDLVMQSNRMN